MKTYYSKVFKAVKMWWQEAIWVRDDKPKIAEEIQAYIDQKQIPAFRIKSLKNHDLFINVKMAKNDGRALAYAGPQIRHPDSQRPITGECFITWFGNNNFVKSKGINLAVSTILHEFGHVIAYISLQRYQKQHMKYLAGAKQWVFQGPKVREMGSKFYGCTKDKFVGMPVQTYSPSRAGGHWSEAWTDWELMSPVGGVTPEVVSPMTMALLEDTKWYKPNYRMIENYTHRKGRGCDFSHPCPKTQICKPGTSGFLTKDKKAIGYCGKNSNGCPVERKYSNANCELGGKWKSNLVRYGAAYGNRCTVVEGRFIDMTKMTVVGMLSVKAQCNGQGTKYQLIFKNHKWNLKTEKYDQDMIVWCNKAGTTKFGNNGYDDYKESVKCHEPKSFCKNFQDHHIGTGSSGVHRCSKTCLRFGRCHPGLYNAHNGAELKGHRALLELRRLSTRNLDTQKCRDPKTGNDAKCYSGNYKCWCYKDGTEQKICPKP